MFPRGYQKSHAKVAKVGKGGFLIGEEIAHVPQSRDALTRAKVGKEAKEDWLLVTGNWGGMKWGRLRLVYVLFRLEKN
jgi:hypothetical protein